MRFSGLFPSFYPSGSIQTYFALQVMPVDKQEVVCVLQNRGMVVGMTGDGVNDAPALSQAQVGIAAPGQCGGPQGGGGGPNVCGVKVPAGFSLCVRLPIRARRAAASCTASPSWSESATSRARARERE